MITDLTVTNQNCICPLGRVIKLAIMGKAGEVMVIRLMITMRFEYFTRWQNQNLYYVRTLAREQHGAESQVAGIISVYRWLGT